MAMMQKIRFYAQERLVIPDMENLQDFMEEDLQLYNTNYYTATSFIVSGFLTEIQAGLDIKVTIAGSTLFNTSGSIKSFYVGDSDEDQLIGAMDDGTTNYVHVELSRGTGSETSRAFWDPTLNNNEGGEFIQDVNTAEFLEVSLYVTQTGWSSDADKIPLAEVVTNLGAILTIKDRRDLFFRLERGDDPTYTYSLATPTEDETDWSSADRQLETTKNWKDFVMTKFKLIQGTAYWWQNPPSSLMASQYNLTGGGLWTWAITPAATTDLTAFRVIDSAEIDSVTPAIAFTGNGTAVGTFQVGSTTGFVANDVIHIADTTPDEMYLVATNLGAGPPHTITCERAELSFTVDAQIVIVGTAFINTIDQATQSPITLGPSYVAYVDLDPTSTVDVPVVVVKNEDFSPQQERMIIARRVGSIVYVG